MREQTLTHLAVSPDSSRDSAAAAGSKMLAVKEGESHVPARIADSNNGEGNVVSRFLYRSSYMLSFGVVYPVMLVVHVVPKNNAIVHGLMDGALAAREQVAGWGGETSPEEPTGEPAHESDAAENGSAHEDRSSEAQDHRRPAARRRSRTKATPKRSSRKR
jgi:hypothetical protein